MSLRVYCPKLKCGGSKEITACLYLCPKHEALRCTEYTRIYPQLADYVPEPKYLEKYGAASIPVPVKFLKRQVRRAKC